MSDDFDKDDLDWLRGDEEPGDFGSDDDDLALDWMQSPGDDQQTPGPRDRLGVTGQLSWLQDDTDTPGQDTTSQQDAGFDWQDAGGDAPRPGSERTGLTGQLSWMQDTASEFESQIDAAEQAARQAAADVPDWMQDIAADDQPEDSTEQAEADVPDWLGGSVFSSEEPAPFLEAPSAEELPEWLRDSDVVEFGQAPGSQPQVDLPEWMSDTSFEDQEQPQAEEAALDWMQSSVFDEAASTSEQVELDQEMVPDWLSGAAPAEITAAVTGDMPEMPDLDEVFGAAQPEAVPDFDNLFGDEDFAPAEEEFDLLGELAGDELPADVDDFDLLGELQAGDETGFDELFGVPAAAEDQDFFQSFVDEEEEPQEDLEALFGGDVLPVGLNVPARDEAGFEIFDDVPAAPADDLDWLSDLGEVSGEMDAATIQAHPSDFEAALEEAPLPAGDDFLAQLGIERPAGLDDEIALPELEAMDQAEGPIYADVDEFLASIDEKSLALPDTGELVSGTNVEFDQLFDKDIDRLEGSKPQKPDLALSPDAPEWLKGVSVTVSDVSASALVRQQVDRPLEELPDRLQALRDRGMKIPTSAEARSTAGLTGLLGREVDTLAPPAPEILTAAMTSPLRLTPDQEKRAGLLRELVGVAESARAAAAGEVSPVEAVVRRAGRLAGIKVDRLLVAALLALAVLLPFIADIKIGELPPAQFAVNSRQRAFFDRVNALQPGDYVLVAPEYGPTSAAELDDATSALLRHVMLRGARPVIVSGNPVGLLHAGNLAAGLGRLPNHDYFMGRYLVAEVVGLRAFSESLSAVLRTDIRGNQTGLEIQSLDEFALIVVIAGRADDVRAWAEQVAPLTRTPMLAVAAASAAPLVEPYVAAGDDDGEIMGMLVGYRDAYTYNAMLALPGNLLTVPLIEIDVTEEITEEVTPELTEAPPVIEPVTTEAPVQPAESPTARPTRQPSNTAPPSTAPPSPTAQETAATATRTPTQTPTPRPTSTPTPSPSPTPQVVRFGIVNTTQRINVRSGPSTGDTVVASLGPGDRVLIVGQNDDSSWFNVLLENGTPGWIAASLLTIEEQIVPAATSTPAEEPTPTREGSGKRRPVNLGQDDAPEATPEASPEAASDTPAAGGSPLSQGEDYRDERWYAMNLGLLAAVVIISVGNVLAVARAIMRRRQR